jgi:hypothetical protein
MYIKGHLASRFHAVDQHAVLANFLFPLALASNNNNNSGRNADIKKVPWGRSSSFSWHAH